VGNYVDAIRADRLRYAQLNVDCQ